MVEAGKWYRYTGPTWSQIKNGQKLKVLEADRKWASVEPMGRKMLTEDEALMAEVRYLEPWVTPANRMVFGIVADGCDLSLVHRDGTVVASVMLEEGDKATDPGILENLIAEWRNNS